MDENRYITDNVLRRYLGMDEYNPQQPRDDRGRWTSSNKNVAKVKKTGKIIQGYEEIYLEPEEYAIVESVFNTYGTKVNKMWKYIGNSYYLGVKENGSWYYVGKEY